MRIPCSACGREEPKSCSRKDCPYFVGRPITLKQDFFGAAPNIFVGKHGYPHVRMGILATEDYANNDDPTGWSAQDTPISKILEETPLGLVLGLLLNGNSLVRFNLDGLSLISLGDDSNNSSDGDLSEHFYWYIIIYNYHL